MKKMLSLFLAGILSLCYALPKQTDVHNAEHLFDEKGVAYLNIPNVGKTYNPAFVALYALNYAGIENYYNTTISPDGEKFRNSIDWLCLNLKKMPNGLWAFPYDFDLTYNDITIKSPWYSAFGQAAGIDALVAGYQRFKDKRYLEAAKRAAETLLTPLEKGGLLFQKDGVFIFEGIPSSAGNPSHILNGNMRAMLAIYKLYTVTKDEKYLTAFRAASESLKKLLPLYDTGYAFRYDLNPKKQQLLFRFNDPYNRKVPPIPIDLVKLVDPVSGKESVIDFGGKSDAVGANRLAGNDWQMISRIDGRSVRPLKAVVPVNPLHVADKGMNSPTSYFYFDLPFEWKNNLRTRPLELVVVYKDTVKGDCSVEMRSMSEGAAFRPLRDGDLLLTGSGEWREWRIPIRPSDLGFWCGSLYAEKHAQYLAELAKIDRDFSSWATVARGYYHLESNPKYKNVVLPRLKLPEQTPGLSEFSFLPQEKVVQQYFIMNGEKLPQYTPFGVALQALDLLKKRKVLSAKKFTVLRPEYAYKWLAKNCVMLDGGAAIWYFSFPNVYNDVLSTPPWTSSFPQSYIVKAMKKALDEKRTNPPLDYEKLYKAAIQAYRTPTEKGSFAAYTRFGVFYEEVPNRTHVLNAHLSSMAELSRHPSAEDVARNGIKTLKETMYLFDAGYWLKYDQNPKKEFLLQIDWEKGKKSPALRYFVIQNPQTLNQTGSVLEQESFEKWPGISGIEWTMAEMINGETAVNFKNGYLIHEKSVCGGTRHNVYLKCSLPERASAEWFNVPIHLLKLVYFDREPGRFQLKTQSIREGNVLKFVPIRNGVLICKGDNKWKEAVFHLRPQDLGWYVGPEYQKYVVEQLEILGRKDWFFKQYALRHKYFLNFNEKKTQQPVKKTLSATLLSSGKTYTGFGVENSLDGDSNNNYTAFYLKSSQDFTLKLSTPVRNLTGVLEFESEVNYASDWKVYALNETGEVITVFAQKDATEREQKFELHAKKEFTCLKFVFTKFHGQQRLLMRQISLKAVKPLSKETGISKHVSSGAEFKIVEIQLDFRNMSGVPRRINVFSTDSQYKRKYETLVDIFDNTQSTLRIPLNKRAAHLSFTFSDFILKQNSIGQFSEPLISLKLDERESDKFKRYQHLHKNIILQGNDPENSLSIIRLPITEFYYVKAREILEKDNLQQGNELEKILAFMKEIAFMKTGLPADNSPFGVLNERIGACGIYSCTLLSLAKTQNLKGRLVSLLNYPDRDGHVVTEIQLNGKWHIFDPTYGLYFKNEKTGGIMSFEELRNPANKAVPVYINKKRYAASGEQTGWGTQRVYLHANPAGPIGPDKPMFFPLFLRVGQTAVMPNLSFQGGVYLGAAMVNNNHHWTFSGLIPGRNYRFIITPAYIGGDLPDKSFAFSYRFFQPGAAAQMKTKTIKLNRGNLSPIQIDFTASAPVVELEVRHPYVGLQFHYLSIKKYELKER